MKSNNNSRKEIKIYSWSKWKLKVVVRDFIFLLNEFCFSFAEEARRVNEERLHFEQAKSELSALRKHYSEADVNKYFLNETKSENWFSFSQQFIVYKVTSKFYKMKTKFYVRKRNR